MLTYDDLVNDMRSGCKPRKDWRIGIEYERFAYAAATGAPLPYDGTPGIRALLEKFAALHGWTIKYEGENPIALEHGQQTITLEPGGQVEYSGSPLATLPEVVAEAETYLRNMDDAARPLGIGFTAKGFPPEWARADIHWMPKGRYKIMRPYMEKVGALGVDMMSRTSGAQINLDFDSETDMVRKFRVALGLQPVAIALMANSRMVEGRDSGFESYRAHIWTDTDKARSGFLPFVFDADMGFARYVDYALNVPMYFIRRGGAYVDVSGQSFRAFMDGKLLGHEGEYPSLSDWHDHLSTLFPDVRLKKYLEFRGPDSHDPDMVYAMAAFWTGLIYNDAALAAAERIIIDNPALLAPATRGNVARMGLRTPLPGTNWPDLCALAGDVLEISRKALHADADLLLPFARIVAQSCPSRKIAI
jgi:glutamate--cysteine ligase